MMDSKRAKLIFRIALACSLVSICLSAYVLGRAQSGPSWEVPVAVVEDLRTIPVRATLLAVVALVLFLVSRQRVTLPSRAQIGMLVTLLIAFALPWLIWRFDPAQWPFRYVTLSSVAAMLIFPTIIVSIVGYWLIGFRWLDNRSDGIIVSEITHPTDQP
jgi:hypothetical protein